MILSHLYLWTYKITHFMYTVIHKMLSLSIIITLFIAQTCFCLAESNNFSFSLFDSRSCENGSNLICWGSVNAANGSLNITPDEPQVQNENGTSELGRVLYRYPLIAWPASFSTTFTIRILTNSTVSGDGIAFVIAQDNKPSPPQSYGSFIGILDPSTEGGVLHQLAVELDTYENAREIDGNHIAIDTTSIEYPVAVKSLSDIGINLKSGRDITVRIEYDGWKKMLKIDVAYAGNPLVNFLNHKIILKDTVPREVYVGFTASTGHFSEIHQVLDWNFTLYELPNESLDEGIALNKCKRAFEFVIPISVVLLLGVMPFVLRARRRRKERLERKEDIEMQTKIATNAPKKFTYKELSKATRNFSKENLLGTGGFGSVYKGVFANSDYPSPIAVKKINATSTQGEREYLAEISTIGRLRHKNLVQLQGWCHDREQLLLVYEYMPNGSLDRYIGKEFLGWKIRYKILSGLASVLLYLHEECGNPVVHRDVKPNNVMLDSEYNAHLGDFGLARLLHNNAFVTTIVAGTIGYLAPEVSYTGRATPESDVYSFGMVVLEVVCGRRSKGIMEDNSLVDYVWSAYEKGSLLSCVDKTLKLDFEEEQVERTLIMGLACLHPDQMLRPRMRKVVQVFMNADEPIFKLPESKPNTVCLSFLPSSSPSTTTCTLTHGAESSMECSPDEMTILYDSCHIGGI